MNQLACPYVSVFLAAHTWSSVWKGEGWCAAVEPDGPITMPSSHPTQASRHSPMPRQARGHVRSLVIDVICRQRVHGASAYRPASCRASTPLESIRATAGRVSPYDRLFSMPAGKTDHARPPGSSANHVDF